MQIKQTVFITKDNRNLVLLHLPDTVWDGCNAYTIAVSIGGTLIEEGLSFFSRKAKLFLPLVEQHSECCVYLHRFCELPLLFKFTLKPVKKWSINFVASSHEDLGYCAYANMLGSECADYLDRAIEIIDTDRRFKYMIEHYWWLKGFEDYRDETSYLRLKQYLNSGHIELNAPHSGVHSHWHGYEQLPRSMYYSGIEAKKKWGITPKLALYADLSGISWSAVSAYMQAGIQYAAVLDNRGWRFSTDDRVLPKIFWWEAPNQKDRLLCWTQYGYREQSLTSIFCNTLRQYPEGTFYFDESKAVKTEEAVNAIIDDLGDVDYDLLPLAFYDDREMPTTMLLTVCEEMNRRWAYPKFGMGLPSQDLAYIADNFGDSIPVLSGDLSDQWADFATIAPDWFAAKREAEVLLPVAETLVVLSALEGAKKGYPRERINEAMWRLCEFDEHCWGTSAKHPLAMHKFNLYLMKRESAKVAKRIVSGIIDDVILSGSETSGFSVWNTIPHRRNATLKLSGRQVPKGVQCQTLSNGVTITEPVDLPAYGFRMFETSRIEPDAQASRFSDTETGIIDTPFYIVTCDPGTHTINSIVEKATNEELLDRSSLFGLGDFIYVNTDTKTSKELQVETAKRRSFQIERGPLAVVIAKTSYEEQSGANVTSTIIFYTHEKNIDVSLKFDHATGLMGDYYDRYKKNIFFAFPFKMENHQFYTELAGGVVNEPRDRLPVNPHDFVVAQNWVAVQNESRGIALYSKEMPVFHLGGIHYNKLSSRVTYENANIYLFAASNRSNQLNFTSKEDCFGEYSLSVLPYQGGWNEQVPDWSVNKTYTPLIGAAYSETNEKSYMSLDADNVRMLSFKRSEEDDDAFIARFIETGVKSATASFKLPFSIQEAVYTNGIEESTGIAAEFQDDTIYFEIDQYSYVTLKIRSLDGLSIPDEQPNPAKITNLFTFVSENLKTILSFEKRHCEKATAFEIYGDGHKLMTVPNEPFKVQWCEIDSIAYNTYTVEAIEE
ncbi:glycoside hydrolase family 38 C-terminal domain-containing protein [Paenibacillus sp. YN15]|uniref:glycoside hydrolase family 38 N-terminal domain-containing protein n=1 Tax=Paenibacillus sp. YN15 TaxID=1742774 RepID=UPI000DCEF49A|nr:glycoside hydrolase family 38 C-terminal domain-containing protein [Paenibacillus sp. YN15]RAU92155.1 hypothetical protein DQG13_27955 [Paenibacillus sp. YN15]